MGPTSAAPALPVGSVGIEMAADVGGTFTDFVYVDGETGALASSKLLTTPNDPSEGVLQGARDCLRNEASRALGQFVHGTTLVINALVERTGARTAFITTEGMRDILEFRRENRYDVYDLAQQYPEPLVPRSLRVGVPERVLASGAVLEDLDETAVRACVERLRAQGVESLAVGFLNSYVNALHEEQVRDIVAREWPEVTVSLSSEVNREQAEYERFSTVVANAYVKPRMYRYLLKLDTELACLGMSQSMLLFGSHGGIIPLQAASELPIALVESGPAGGALAAAYVAGLLGYTDVLAVDMGGTTAKMCGIRGGRVVTRYDYEAARVSRFSAGSGLPLRVPVVDIIEIGAGGGSIAGVDEFGLLTVGPSSAGAEPGPACYGRGGTAPTVTDADVVLGRLNPADFLGGRMPLSRALAEKAIQGALGEQLGLSASDTAMGISDVVDEYMAITGTEYLRERGIDPRGLAMVAYGGMGPVHAASLAERMGIDEILIPPLAGVFSAVGFLLAPRSLELTQSFHGLLEAIDYERLVQTAEALAERAAQLMQATNAARAEFTVAMRYRGQWHPIDVVLPRPAETTWSQELLTRAFEEAYSALYEQISEDISVEMLTLRVGVVESSGVLALPPGPDGNVTDALHERCDEPVTFSRGLGQSVTQLTPRLRRDALSVGFRASGPLVIVEEFTTTVVPERWELSVEPFGVLRVRRQSTETSA